MISGSACGEVFLWDVPERRIILSYQGHKCGVRALAVSHCGTLCFSCGDDGIVKMWRVPHAPLGGIEKTLEDTALETYDSEQNLKGLDHHWDKNVFATAGEKVDVWDHERSTPIHSFTWGADSVQSVRFNPVCSTILINGFHLLCLFACLIL